MLVGYIILMQYHLIQWKEMPDGSIVIKARLVVKGFQDPQGFGVETFSPTAGRQGQRMLLSTSVIYSWAVVSMDIGTAFLQGDPLEKADKVRGVTRRGVMNPPRDAWEHLPSSFAGIKEARKNLGQFLWELVKAVCGLKDAPRLWIAALVRWLDDLGFVRGHTDKMCFFLRADSKGTWSTKKNRIFKGTLVGMVVGHVDDLGVSGGTIFIQWLHKEAEGRFGATRLEGGTFLHVGLQYRNLPSGEKSADLEEFIRQIPHAKVPHDVKAPLNAKVPHAKAPEHQWQHELRHQRPTRCLGAGGYMRELSRRNTHWRSPGAGEQDSRLAPGPCTAGPHMVPEAPYQAVKDHRSGRCELPQRPQQVFPLRVLDSSLRAMGRRGHRRPRPPPGLLREDLHKGLEEHARGRDPEHHRSF